MFNFFKKKSQVVHESKEIIDIELTASVLAYEVARSDGDISANELSLLESKIKEISKKVKKSEKDIFKLIEDHSKSSISFHDYISDINDSYTQEDKHLLISFLWEVAYADFKLDVDEERLIRRVADLIRIKDVDVLKLKDRAKI
tara:strand:+ start:3546 stop:3977 length:432 start_codon:yes stop_codon:yes gene_type:complete